MIHIISNKQKKMTHSHSSLNNKFKESSNSNNINQGNNITKEVRLNSLRKYKKNIPLKIPCYSNQSQKETPHSLLKLSPKSRLKDYLKDRPIIKQKSTHLHILLRKSLSCFNMSLKEYTYQREIPQISDEQREINKQSKLKPLIKLGPLKQSRNMSFDNSSLSKLHNLTYYLSKYNNSSTDFTKSTKDNSKGNDKQNKTITNSYRQNNKKEDNDMETPESLHFAFVALMQKSKESCLKYDNLEDD